MDLRFRRSRQIGATALLVLMAFGAGCNRAPAPRREGAAPTRLNKSGTTAPGGGAGTSGGPVSNTGGGTVGAPAPPASGGGTGVGPVAPAPGGQSGGVTGTGARAGLTDGGVIMKGSP